MQRSQVVWYRVGSSGPVYRSWRWDLGRNNITCILKIWNTRGPRNYPEDLEVSLLIISKWNPRSEVREREMAFFVTDYEVGDIIQWTVRSIYKRNGHCHINRSEKKHFP